MNQVRCTLAITFVTILCLAPAVLGSKVEPGKIPGGEFGVVYECAFPNTVKLDGDLIDAVWQLAPWHFVDSKTGTGPAPDDADASIAFAAVADDIRLYVAIKVTDDKIQSGENVGGDVWQDDSVEIYIDPNYGQTQTYETVDGNWDSQITVGADNIGGVIDKPLLGGGGDGPGTGTKAAVVKVPGGWNVEAAVPLKSQGKWDIKPKDGMVIGFNIHFNDDDDGGGRDHKLIWSKKDVDDQSWQNPSRFAELKFVAAILSEPTPVEPQGKLPFIWGHLKANR